MANEIHIDYASGNTLYAIIRNAAGKVWHITGQQFEDFGSSGHDMDDYDIPLSDKDGGRYLGNFDANIPAGRYSVQIYLRFSDSPNESDELIGSGLILWTGSAELTADKILANKAIQNKLTGAIDYYDDDAQTVILTHTPTDDESTLTRTPS